MRAGELRGAGVEDLIVAVSDGDVSTVAEKAEGMGDEVNPRTCGEPQLAAHGALGEVEGAAFGYGDESPAHVKVGVETGVETADFAVLLVDPDSAGEFAEGSEGLAVGGRVALAGEVEDEGGATVEDGAARMREAHDGEELGDGDGWVTGGLAGWRVFGLGNLALDEFLLLALCAGAERAAVLPDEFVDFMGVDEEDPELASLGGLDVAVAVELLDDLLLAVGVVFAEGIHLALMGDDLAEEGWGVGDGGLRFCRGGRGLREERNRTKEQPCKKTKRHRRACGNFRA